jgi:hypothetical protein
MTRSQSIISSVLVVGAILAIAGFAEEKPEFFGVQPVAAPSAVGAWFGIARPCPADPAGDSPVHAAFCQAICGTCGSIPGTLPPEVPMMPVFVSDGTVTADDAGEIGRYHTTAHGHWVASSGDGLPDWTSPTTGAVLARSKATFFWLGSSFGPGAFNGSPATAEPYGTCCFNNVVRPRFVAYFDPSNPNEMIGFIQPYAVPSFTSASTGLVTVVPYNGSNPLEGNHIPVPQNDLIGNPLPAGCQNNLGCLGTYHFVIRRIQPN